MKDKNKKEDDGKERIGEKLRQRGKEILARSEEVERQAAEFKRKEVEEVAKEILNACPECNSRENFEKIAEILTAFQAKMEEPIKRMVEMRKQEDITRIMSSRPGDDDYLANLTAAKMMGLPHPGLLMEEISKTRIENKRK